MYLYRVNFGVRCNRPHPIIAREMAMNLQRRNLLSTSRLWNSRFPRRSRLVEEEKRTPASVESRSLIIKLVRATSVALHYIKNCSKCKYCITHIRPTPDQIFLRNKIFRFQRHEYGWCGFIIRKFCNRYFLTIPSWSLKERYKIVTYMHCSYLC